MSDHKKFELMFAIPVIGFINSLEFSSDGSEIFAGIGKEHRIGRWWNIKEARNHVIIIPFIMKKNQLANNATIQSSGSTTDANHKLHNPADEKMNPTQDQEGMIVDKESSSHDDD